MIYVLGMQVTALYLSMNVASRLWTLFSNLRVFASNKAYLFSVVYSSGAWLVTEVCSAVTLVELDSCIVLS